MPAATMATIPAVMQASRKAFMAVHLSELNGRFCKCPAAGTPRARALRHRRCASGRAAAAMPASWFLFCRSCGSLRARFIGASPGIFLLEPKTVVLLRPVNIHGATAHRFEGPLHADGANVYVSQHRCDKEHCDHRMHDLGELHPFDSRQIEWEHQLITCTRNGRAADHDDPVDRLLAGIEAIGERLIVTADTSASLEPIDIDPIRDDAGDPQ